MHCHPDLSAPIAFAQQCSLPWRSSTDFQFLSLSARSPSPRPNSYGPELVCNAALAKDGIASVMKCDDAAKAKIATYKSCVKTPCVAKSSIVDMCGSSPSPQTDAQGNTPTTTIKVALTIEGTILFSSISSLSAFTDTMRQGLKKTLAIKCDVTADKVTLVITLMRRRRRHRGLAGDACRAGETWSASGTNRNSDNGIGEGCNFCTNHAFAGGKCEFGVKTTCTPTSDTVCGVEGG